MQLYLATIPLHPESTSGVTVAPLPTSLFKLKQNACNGRACIIWKGIDSCKCHQTSHQPDWSASSHSHRVSHPLLLYHVFCFSVRRGKDFTSLKISWVNTDVYKSCFTGLTTCELQHPYHQLVVSASIIAPETFTLSLFSLLPRHWLTIFLYKSINTRDSYILREIFATLHSAQSLVPNKPHISFRNSNI